MNKDKSFWFVWNSDGEAPKYRHGSYDSALNEATRLARQCRGQEFIVLESVVSVKVNDTIVTDLRPEIVIPF